MISLEEQFEAIAERVFARMFSEWKQNQGMREIPVDALELREKLARINSKERISIGEAALLLGCSDGHVRNLIRKARKRQTRTPIPFCDLDGVTVFSRLALLSWAESPKHKLQDVSS
jgi:hypothetical protein